MLSVFHNLPTCKWSSKVWPKGLISMGKSMMLREMMLMADLYLWTRMEIESIWSRTSLINSNNRIYSSINRTLMRLSIKLWKNQHLCIRATSMRNLDLTLKEDIDFIQINLEKISCSMTMNSKVFMELLTVAT
jgi:hypothetical protein